MLSKPDTLSMCRKNCLRAGEALTEIFLPFTCKNQYLGGYKQSHKRDEQLAVGNAAFCVALEHDQSSGGQLIAAPGLLLSSLPAVCDIRRGASASLCFCIQAEPMIVWCSAVTQLHLGCGTVRRGLYTMPHPSCSLYHVLDASHAAVCQSAISLPQLSQYLSLMSGMRRLGNQGSKGGIGRCSAPHPKGCPR